MTPDLTRWQTYKICSIRGHDPANVVLTTNPPMSVCKWCGTHYRYESETRVVESNVPTEDPSSMRGEF